MRVWPRGAAGGRSGADVAGGDDPGREEYPADPSSWGVLTLPTEQEKTRAWRGQAEEAPKARDVLLQVYEALQEKGYNPIYQIVGYLLSGDPAYVTSHKSARSLIRRLERDELLEELVRSYLEKHA